MARAKRAWHTSCYAQHCRQPAKWAFLAVTGDQANKVVLPGGKRLRCCQGHLMATVAQLGATFRAMPGGGPARLRAVEL